MDLNRLPVKTIKVSDKLVLKVSRSLENDSLFLTINYLGGKFSLEKVFKNNVNGNEGLDKAIKDFNVLR